MTNGNKNTIKSDSLNLHKFWDLNKNKKYQKSENQVRTFELMKKIAINILENNEINKEYAYYDFIEKVAKGNTVTNKFGKKLYFKLGE